MQVGPVSVDLLLPTSVSLEQSIRKSLCRICLGDLQGSLETADLTQIMSNKQDSQQSFTDYRSIKLPKRTSLDINGCNIRINSKDFLVSSVFCLFSAKTVLKLRAEAKDLELKCNSDLLVSLPALDIELICQEKRLEVTHSANFLYLALGKDLADFISGCLPLKPPLFVPNPAVPMQSYDNLLLWSQSIHLSTLKMSLLQDLTGSELLKGEVLDLKIALNRTNSLEVTLTGSRAAVLEASKGEEILTVAEPDVIIEPQSVDFLCAAVRAHWIKPIHELCYPSILTIIRSFANRHRKSWKSSKPGKNVNLDFVNVSAAFTFATDEAIRAEVARFQVDITAAEKLLHLSFSQSNLYLTETIEKLLLTCQDLSVSKKYTVKGKEMVAEIEVEGGGIDLLVPELYPWGRAVFKSTVNIVGGIRWTLGLLFPGKVRVPHVVLMETAVTTLTLARVKVVIMDGSLHNSIRKKLLLKPESDIYPQLKSLPDTPFLILSFDMTTGVFDNTRLSNAKAALSALQEIDPFEIPAEDYFAFVMANDLKMVFSGCSGQLRDYPWKLYKVATLTLKGRSMITKNRLPLHNWSRWKIHSNMGIRLDQVEFTLGLCLRSTLIDVSCM